MASLGRFGVPSAAAVLVLLAAFVFAARAARSDETTVYDENSLMSDASIAQIEARNQHLYGATGRVVVVAVVRTGNGTSALDSGTAIADRLAKDRYGAIVWVATGSQQSNIVFVGKALKWVPYDQQVALQRELGTTIRYCCPGDALPGIVDKVATAMETGSKIAPSPSNYVRDGLGELDNQQTANIVARDQRLEAATGKGIAVLLFSEEAGKDSSALANAVAQSLDVKGQIAAIVWVGQGPVASHFAMVQTSGFNTIPDATVDSINSNFQADMQTGNFGDAIVAAVDRTATSLEGTSTPMPTLPPEPQEIASPQPVAAANAPPSGLPLALPGRGASGTGTAIAIFVAFAIIVLFVTMALRREHQKTP